MMPDWECPECAYNNFGTDDECQRENCWGLRPWSQVALETQIEGSYAPDDPQVLPIQRAFLGLLELEKSEFARRSRTFAFFLGIFETVLMQAAALDEMQGSVYMVMNRMPDTAPDAFEAMDEAYREVEERLTQLIHDATGPDEYTEQFNKLFAAYILQMFQELRDNGPESAP